MLNGFIQKLTARDVPVVDQVKDLLVQFITAAQVIVAGLQCLRVQMFEQSIADMVGGTGAERNIVEVVQRIVPGPAQIVETGP